MERCWAGWLSILVFVSPFHLRQRSGPSFSLREKSVRQILQENVPISTIIQNFVELTEVQPGKYKGLCPFHDDSNPSMWVVDDKQFFHCFSCKASGNVFKFIEKYEHKTYVEAMERVASLSGLGLNFTSYVGGKLERSVVIAILTLAAAITL